MKNEKEHLMGGSMSAKRERGVDEKRVRDGDSEGKEKEKTSIRNGALNLFHIYDR